MIAAEEKTEADFEKRLAELNSQLDETRKELARTCKVLTYEGANEMSKSALNALHALQHSETAKIIELTGETHRIAGKMSYNIRLRDTERVVLVWSLASSCACV